jgi:aspartate-semialdehyde dehydrogenase
VPLLVPEVNADHTALIDVQRRKRGWEGWIVTSANCSTTQLVLALKPLFDAYGLSKLSVVTLQAVSGAGYPGVPSLDILGNIVP